MKKIGFLLIALVLSCAQASAAVQWSGSPWGPDGIGVDAVYPHFPTQRLVFKGDNGNFYYYQWDVNSQEMTFNAKFVMSTLMTALTAGKKVALYYDTVAPGGDGYLNFTQVILLK